MKPEVRAAQAVELNDAEKALLKMIEAQSPVLLNDLKPNPVYPIKNGIRPLKD